MTSDMVTGSLNFIRRRLMALLPAIKNLRVCIKSILSETLFSPIACLRKTSYI